MCSQDSPARAPDDGVAVVMIGGAVWGIPGMFLAIPLTAICKVVFDRVPSLEPFGYVLGSDDGTPKEPSTRKGCLPSSTID